MNIELLDYLLDEDENFWIVTKIDKKIYGYIVYKVDIKGTRYNNITKKYYTKLKNDEFEIPNNIKRIFKPGEFYIKNKQNITGVWKKYIDILNNIGIEDKDIGIFGSYLIGFDVIKDIDFVIYGYKNLLKYYNNINLIHTYTNTSHITQEHIEYQYNKFKDEYNKNCDLLKMISKNWAAIQIKEGVLQTPRFILRQRQQTPIKSGDNKLIKVKITDGLQTACFPRYCKCEYNNEEYEIYSHLWKYQSFADTNEIIEIYGNVNEEQKIIIIDDKINHYVKYN